MGYRSELAYVIVFEAVDKRDTFVELMRAKNDPHINVALGEVGIDENDRYITFRAEGIKWYESYPEVRAHQTLLDDAVQLFDATTRFVRIGEESDDVEDDVCDSAEWSTGEVWELIGITRAITTNF